MNVTPEAVAQRLGAGLAPSLEREDRIRQIAFELGRELLDYGVSVMPRELYRGRSGSEIAGLVAEDVEAAVWMEPLLRPRQIERTVEPDPPASTDGDEAPAPGPKTIVEEVRPRVVELGSGWSLTAFVLAYLYPDQPIELVEPERPRLWFWRRLCSLYQKRNLRVHLSSHEDFIARNAGGVDLAIVKRHAPADALDLAVPLVREGGRVLSFQRSDRAAEIRKPRTNASGVPVRLESEVRFESAAARGRHLLCVGVGLDGSAPAA